MSEAEPKYATEIYALLRLFDRVGRSFAGLLILELGWVLLANQIAKLGASPPADEERVPTPAFWVLWMWAGGACVLLFGWILYSRLFHYFIRPLRHALRPVAVAITIFAGLALGTMLIPVAILLAIAESVLSRRWLANERRKQLQRRTRAGEADPEAAYVRYLRDLGEKHGDVLPEHRRTSDASKNGERVLLQIRRNELPVRASDAHDFVGSMLKKALVRLFSSARLGLAMPVSHNYTEAFNADKVPLQMFATAISRLRGKLSGIGALDYFEFYELPPHLQISSVRRARLATRIFGLDALLWGSYLGASGQKLWLNIERRTRGRPRPADDDHGGDDERKLDFEFQYRLFPSTLEIDVPSVTLSQEDHQQTFLVLLLTVAQILQDRQARHRAYGWDVLAQHRQSRERLVRALILEAANFLGEPSEETALPSVAQQVAETVSAWVGHQLTPKSVVWELRASDARTAAAERLCELLERCARTLPASAETFYRWGAVCCIGGDLAALRHEALERALRHFARAEGLQAAALFGDYIAAQVCADVALRDAARNTGIDESLSLARFAAHAAAALHMGGMRAAEGIERDMEEVRLNSVGLFVHPAIPELSQNRFAVDVVLAMISAVRSGANGRPRVESTQVDALTDG
jgi:hypothetical protein